MRTASFLGWLPFARLCTAVGRAVERMVRVRVTESRPEIVAPAVVLSKGKGHWPADADLHYFNSEIQVARLYVDMTAAPGVDAARCLSRAFAIYIELSGWLQSHGGNTDLEYALQRLRWRIAAARSDDESVV